MTAAAVITTAMILAIACGEDSREGSTFAPLCAGSASSSRWTAAGVGGVTGPDACGADWGGAEDPLIGPGGTCRFGSVGGLDGVDPGFGGAVGPVVVAAVLCGGVVAGSSGLLVGVCLGPVGSSSDGFDFRA